jgi:hypothetical protein
MLIDEREVSKLLSLPVARLRIDRCRKRGLPFVRIGASIRYKVEDIEKFIAAHTVDFTAPADGDGSRAA